MILDFSMHSAQFSSIRGTCNYWKKSWIWVSAKMTFYSKIQWLKKAPKPREVNCLLVWTDCWNHTKMKKVRERKVHRSRHLIIQFCQLCHHVWRHLCPSDPWLRIRRPRGLFPFCSPYMQYLLCIHIKVWDFFPIIFKHCVEKLGKTRDKNFQFHE